MSRNGRTLHQSTRHGLAGVLYSDALSGPLQAPAQQVSSAQERRAEMDRGVIVGGGLIAASFLVAVLLNRSAHEDDAPAVREPPAPICADPGPPQHGASPLADSSAGKCERRPDSSQR
jgi:hypothetical protein